MKNYQRLRDVREDADKTQEEIAKILGIRQSDYGKYERGDNKMGIDKYIILAKYYNISIDYLVGIIPTPKPLQPKKEVKK